MLEQKLRNRQRAAESMSHYSNDGARPHVGRQSPTLCCPSSRLSQEGTEVTSLENRSDFSSSHCAPLVFDNGRLEEVPDSVLRELSDVGQFAKAHLPFQGLIRTQADATHSQGLTFRARRQACPNHPIPVPDRITHPSSRPFLFFFLKISVSRAILFSSSFAAFFSLICSCKTL